MSETTFRVVKIDADGVPSTEEWNLEPSGQVLPLLQGAVGGEFRRVDCVNLLERLDMWIGEESMHEFEPNPVATALAASTGLVWQKYHGPVVLAGVDPTTGRTLPLSADHAVFLVHQARKARRVLGLD